MFPLRIVEHLDLVEHVLAGVFASLVGPSRDPLSLEQVEKALGDGVVVTFPRRLIECSRLWAFRKDAQSMLVNWEPWSE